MLYRGTVGDGRSLMLALAALAGAFCLLSALLYYSSAFMLAHSDFRFSRIAAGDIHVDVLVAGNSRARDLLTGSEPGAAPGDQAHHAPSVYNLAYNGLSREDTIAWIKTYFRQGNSANTLIIEASALFEAQHYCDSKPYWVVYPELRAAQRGACARDARSARYFPLTMFDSEQYLRALYYYVWNRHGDQAWADDYQIPQPLCQRLPLDNIFAFQRFAQQFDLATAGAEIVELKAWLASHGYRTRVVFVLAPFMAAPDALAAIADIDRVARTLLGSEDYLSLSNALGADCRDFADSEHIGAEGRRKVRALMFRYLASLPPALLP
jgi:hypothetical protein